MTREQAASTRYRDPTSSARPWSVLGRQLWLAPRVRWLALMAALLAWSAYRGGIWERELINLGGWALSWQFLTASLSPVLTRDFLGLTLSASLTTLAYAVAGTALSVGLGLLGGLFSSETWWQARAGMGRRSSAPWLIARALLAVPRAIHEVIWGLLFVNVLGLDPLTAVLGIGIPFGAICAKVFSEIIDEAPRKPLEALLASGVSPGKALMYSTLPQAFPNMLSYAFYRFECSIRSAAVLGIIGAGGLGYQILLSLQSLRYREVWTFLYALLLLSGLTDMWSASLRRRLGAPSRVELQLAPGRRPVAERVARPRRDPWIMAAGLTWVVLIPFSLIYIGADVRHLWAPRTRLLLAELTRSAFPPDLSAQSLSTLWRLSGETLAMSVLAIAFAAILGALLSVPAVHPLTQAWLRPDGRAASWTRTIVWLLARGALLTMRAVPTPIWALILMFVMFPGMIPGAIALGLHTAGILGRLMAEVIENMDDRPLMALKAQGASPAQAFLYGAVPAILPGFWAYGLYRWEVAIRETVIVGLVGAGGLGRLLAEQLSGFDYRGMMATLLAFFVLTLIVDQASAAIRRAFR